MDMRMLGAALFEQGFLGTRSRRVKDTCDNLGLGDIGYMTENDNFVVVGNVFNLILSTYSRSPSHFPDSDIWNAECGLSHRFDYCSLENPRDAEILEYSGQSYWRQRHIDLLPAWFLD